MAANANLILAGIAGTGGTPSLAWFAPLGSTGPDDATTALDGAFEDAGWCTQDGIAISNSTDTTDIDGFGSFAAVRTLTTKVEQTAKVTFLETNPIAVSVFNSLPLTGTGSISVTGATGALDWTSGPARAQKYSAVFDTVDGDNHLRVYCPNVEVTDREDFSVAQGAPIQYGVTLKAFADGSGNAVYFFSVLADLITP